MGTDVSSTSPRHLTLDDWWPKYFGDTSQARQRRLFAGVSD
jgi:hypothetical protein